MSEPGQQGAGNTEHLSSGSPEAKSHKGSRFYLWVLALAAVQAVLLHAALFGGRGLVPTDGIFDFPPWLCTTNGASNPLLGDQYLVFIPQREFTHQEFEHGRFPLWNPYLDCGEPNVASVQGALLFPINLLLLPVDPFYAAGIAAFLKLFLAGLFTMLYLRLIGASDSGAFLSGLVFSLCGFMICWLGHPHINCAMCLPILLFLVEKTFHYGRGTGPGLTSAPALRVWAFLSVVIGCFLLSGYPPLMVDGAILVSVYFLFRLVGEPNGRPMTRVGLAAGAAVVGFCLAAPALLPFLEYYRHSSMNASSAALDRTAYRSPLSTLILYLVPRLGGSPTDGFGDTLLWLGIGNLIPNFVERTGYVGVLPLLFALCAVVFRRSRWTLFYLFVAVVSTLGIFGVPPFPEIFHALPILRQISPMRLIVIASLGVAVLAGLGWDSFWELPDRRKRVLVAAACWSVVGLILLGYGIRFDHRWKFLDASHRAFLKPQFLMLAGSFIASMALLLPSLARHRGLRAALGLGWIAADLVNFGMGLNPAIPKSSYYPSVPAIKWLQQDKSNFRILGLGMALVPDTAEVFGLKDARGYDFTTVRNYEELIDGNAGSFFFYRTATALPAALPLLAVKYVLNFNSPTPDPAQFDLVYSNQITIYRNREFQGRVLTVFHDEVDRNPSAILAKVRSGTFNPEQTILLEQKPFRNETAALSSAVPARASARITDDEPDEVDVQASMPRPGFLLLLDTYYPGWKATVNGQRSAVLRADYDFRAVQLPAGKSYVRFVYQPASFRLGLVLSLAGLTLLAGIFGASMFGPRNE